MSSSSTSARPRKLAPRHRRNRRPTGPVGGERGLVVAKAKAEAHSSSPRTRTRLRARGGGPVGRVNRARGPHRRALGITATHAPLPPAHSRAREEAGLPPARTAQGSPPVHSRRTCARPSPSSRCCRRPRRRSRPSKSGAHSLEPDSPSPPPTRARVRKTGQRVLRRRYGDLQLSSPPALSCASAGVTH